MLQPWVTLVVSFCYLGILFAIAYYADKRADAGRSIISNPYIYTLSIAVYCTAWTFYGSVGRAATTGAGFLPIYLGPTLMAALWWYVLRKIIRIAKVHRLTSIADFIASRYAKDPLIGGIVTIIAVVGILPYISLQLKAVSTSFNVLHSFAGPSALLVQTDSIWHDTALYVALIMALFHQHQAGRGDAAGRDHEVRPEAAAGLLFGAVSGTGAHGLYRRHLALGCLQHDQAGRGQTSLVSRMVPFWFDGLYRRGGCRLRIPDRRCLRDDHLWRCEIPGKKTADRRRRHARLEGGRLM